MAMVHAVGWNEPLLSHFDATKAIERGTAGRQIETGWIGRHLAATPAPQFGHRHFVTAKGPCDRPRNPACLVRQQGGNRSIRSPTFGSKFPPAGTPAFTRVLRQMYGRGKDFVSSAGRETFAMLEVLQLSAFTLPAREFGPLFAGRFWQPSQPGGAIDQGRRRLGGGCSQPCRLG